MICENIMYGLKGLCNIAQGNALGKRCNKRRDALKGQDKKLMFILPFQGED